MVKCDNEANKYLSSATLHRTMYRDVKMPWYFSVLRLVVPWWQSPVYVPDAARSLLHNYAGISKDQVEQHVTTFVRRRTL